MRHCDSYFRASQIQQQHLRALPGTGDGCSEHPTARLQHLAHSGLCGRPDSGVRSYPPGAGQDVAVVLSNAGSL